MCGQDILGENILSHVKNMKYCYQLNEDGPPPYQKKVKTGEVPFHHCFIKAMSMEMVDGLFTDDDSLVRLLGHHYQHKIYHCIPIAFSWDKTSYYF